MKPLPHVVEPSGRNFTHTNAGYLRAGQWCAPVHQQESEAREEPVLLQITGSGSGPVCQLAQETLTLPCFSFLPKLRGDVWVSPPPTTGMQPGFQSGVPNWNQIFLALGINTMTHHLLQSMLTLSLRSTERLGEHRKNEQRTLESSKEVLSPGFCTYI